jgi:hypothetical protein
MMGVMRADDEPERITLPAGEQVLVAWDRDEIEQTREEFNGSRFTHCEFIDSLGNIYSAPYPGMKITRKNWRLKREYVPVRLPGGVAR